MAVFGKALGNGYAITSLIGKKELMKEVLEKFDEKNFANTDLSHSKAIIELEGKDLKEVLKKGCPYNFNELHINNCINSTFNGIQTQINACCKAVT